MPGHLGQPFKEVILRLACRHVLNYTVIWRGDVSTVQTSTTKSVQHREHYDVREASKNYSNIASVLAGFAFAAVVLVVQSTLPANVPAAIILRDLSSIAFLLAFFGCIVSAFTFSVVAGEEALTPRSHSMAFIAGSGFALSAICIFWGLATLIEIFLSPWVISTAYLILGGFVFICPIFLIMSWLDVSIAFDDIEIKRIQIPTQTLATLFIVGYAPLFVGVLSRASALRGLNTFTAIVYNIIFLASFALILVGTIWSLVFSNAEYEARVSFRLCAIWIGIHSCVFAALIMLLP